MKKDMKMKAIVLVLVVAVISTVFLTGGWFESCNIVTEYLALEENSIDLGAVLDGYEVSVDKEYHFDFSEKDWNLLGTRHTYEIYNQGESNIDVYFDVPTKSSYENERTAVVLKPGESRSVDHYGSIAEIDGSKVGRFPRFRVVPQGKSEVTVVFMRYVDSMEVKTLSYCWTPNGERESDAEGTAFSSTISKLYLSKAAAQKLGKILIADDFQDSISSISNDNTSSKQLYKESILRIFATALTNTEIDPEFGEDDIESVLTKQQGAFAKAITVGILEGIVSLAGYSNFKNKLVAKGEELTTATSAVVVSFEKSTYSFDINISPLDTVIKNKKGEVKGYVLMGAYGYTGGTFEKISFSK